MMIWRESEQARKRYATKTVFYVFRCGTVKTQCSQIGYTLSVGRDEMKNIITIIIDKCLVQIIFVHSDLPSRYELVVKTINLFCFGSGLSPFAGTCSK